MLERSRNPECLSDLRLDRLQADELDPAAQVDARRHLAGCPLCSARLAELDADRDRYRAAPRPMPRRPAEAQAARPRRRAHAWLWPATAAATLGVLFLLWPRPADRNGDEPGHASLPEGDSRRKGRDRLGFYVKRGGQVVPGATGEAVHPGDSIRFAYTADQPVFLVVASVDASGRASIYHPAGPRAEELPPGSDRLLPDSIELDESVGTEVVYGFFCQEAVDVAAVERALAGGRPALAGCRIDRLTLEKRAP